MAYSVPDLPYDYDALEPHIDEATMRVHHDKHHQAYVDKANAALEGTEWADKDVEEVLRNLSSLPEDKQGPVRNNGGGHYNHSLFWQMLSPDGGGEPGGDLGAAIDEKFGSFDAFKGEFKEAGIDAVRLRLGLAGPRRLAAWPSRKPRTRTRPSPAARRRCSAATSGSTPTTSSTRTSAPTTSTPSGTSSTGTTSPSASPTRAEPAASAATGIAGRAASGRWRGSSPSLTGIWLIACSALAVIVRLGLTPGLAGIAAPSVTSRFS